MSRYRKNPVEIEAVQFTGDNWAEMHEFTGHDKNQDGQPFDVFGSATPDGLATDVVRGELWVAADQEWGFVDVGYWVVRFDDGFRAYSNKFFQETYTEVTLTGLPVDIFERTKDLILKAKEAFEERDIEPESGVTEEPTEPGFYYNEGAAQVMIYLLDRHGQWYAILDYGTMDKCEWGYIEQTVLAYPLRRLGD